jgi:hypothetical protein
MAPKSVLFTTLLLLTAARATQTDDRENPFANLVSVPMHGSTSTAGSARSTARSCS